MIHAPYVIALIFGLLISGGIYFIFYWPDVEPDDEPHGARDLRALARDLARDEDV